MQVVELSIDYKALPAHLKHGDWMPRIWYVDADGDGFGDASKPTVKACTPPRPAGYAAKGGDCDDGNAATYPGAPEVRRLCCSVLAGWQATCKPAGAATPGGGQHLPRRSRIACPGREGAGNLTLLKLSPMQCKCADRCGAGMWRQLGQQL